MGRRCTVCSHPEREAIDRAIVSQSVANRELARRYGLCARAIDRHAANHVAEDLALAQRVREEAAKKAAGLPAKRPDTSSSKVVAEVVEDLEEEGRRAIDLQLEWHRISRDLEHLAAACRKALLDEEGRFRPPVDEASAAAAIILLKVTNARQRGVSIAGRMLEFLEGGEDEQGIPDLSKLTIAELEVLTGRSRGF